MKKFFTAILLAAAGVGLYSCNNGAYDARPDDPSGFNYLNPNSPVKVPLGTIRVKIDNITYDYYPSFYKDVEVDVNGKKYVTKFFQGVLANDPMFKRVFSFTVGEIKDIATSDFAYDFSYAVTDTTNDTVAFYRRTEDFKFEIKGMEDNNFRGVFKGPLKLDKGKRNDYGLPETIVIQDAEYYLPPGRGGIVFYDKAY